MLHFWFCLHLAGVPLGLAEPAFRAEIPWWKLKLQWALGYSRAMPTLSCITPVSHISHTSVHLSRNSKLADCCNVTQKLTLKDHFYVPIPSEEPISADLIISVIL